MPRSTRLFAVGIAILLFLLLVVGGFFLYWPTFLTAPCYDLTVTAVTFPAPGKFRIEYEDRLVYGWGVAWQYEYSNARGRQRKVSSDFWSFENKPFLRWPRTSRGLQIEYEATMEEGYILADESTLRPRILIKPGGYRLHPGEQLVFYRGESSEGKPLQGVIVMQPDTPDDGTLEFKPDSPR
jgi:hypothetical protein